jgi:hypothetical protein
MNFGEFYLFKNMPSQSYRMNENKQSGLGLISLKLGRITLHIFSSPVSDHDDTCNDDDITQHDVYKTNINIKAKQTSVRR